MSASIATVSPPPLAVLRGAERIQAIADIAWSLAVGCSFSRNADWFWSVAEAELEQCLWSADDRWIGSSGMPGEQP